MDVATRQIIAKYSPMWTVKETFDYEQKHGEPLFDVKYAHGDDEKTVWGDRKMKYPNSTLRELWNNTYDCLDSHYEMWIKDVSKHENDQPSITDDHVRYALSMTVEDMFEDEWALKFRMVNGCLVIGVDSNADFKATKEFYEEFYHLIHGFDFAGDHLDDVPEDEDESNQYFIKLQDDFDQKMKAKLGDRYIPANKEKISD